MKKPSTINTIPEAVDAIKSGEVIAYPTESCYGLGCDPNNLKAVEKIIALKSRSSNKGLILIAASVDQAEQYVDLKSSPFRDEILASWPGPNTWLLPPKEHVLPALRGEFPLLAIRVTAHPEAKRLCEAYGGAIVSTSANISGTDSLVSAESVIEVFTDFVKVVEGLIDADKKPSTIRNGMTGDTLRK